jgi:dTDP-4-amino-4,6-dideoxygalactose transaminase
VEHNYSYFPVFIDETEYGKSRDNLYELLKNNGVFARRYFYPLISEFPMYTNFPSSKKTNLPMALKVSTQVLCLPIYPDLQPSEVFSILSIIND